MARKPARRGLAANSTLVTQIAFPGKVAQDAPLWIASQ